MPPSELQHLKTGFGMPMTPGLGMNGQAQGGFPYRRSPRSMATYSMAQLKFQPQPFAGVPMRKVPATAAGVQQIKQAELGSFPESFFCRLVEQGRSLDEFPLAIKRASVLVGDEAAAELQEAFDKLTQKQAGGFQTVKDVGMGVVDAVPWGAAKNMFSRGVGAAKGVFSRGAKVAPKAAPTAAPGASSWVDQARNTMANTNKVAPQVVRPAARQWAKETAQTAAATGALNAARENAYGDPNASYGEWGRNLAGAAGRGVLYGAATGAVPGRAGSVVRTQVRNHATAATGAGMATEQAGRQFNSAKDMTSPNTFRQGPDGKPYIVTPEQLHAENRGRDFDTGAIAGLSLPSLGRFFRGAPGAATQVAPAAAAAQPVANTAANSGWSTLRKGIGYGAGALGVGGGAAIASRPDIIPETVERGARAVTDTAINSPAAGPLVDRAVDRAMDRAAGPAGASGGIPGQFVDRAIDRVMARPEVQQFTQPLQNMGEFWSNNREWLAPMLMQGLAGAGGGYMLGGGKGMMAGMLGLPALIQGAQYMAPDSLGNPAVMGALHRLGLTGGDQGTIDANQNNLVRRLMQSLVWDEQNQWNQPAGG